MTLSVQKCKMCCVTWCESEDVNSPVRWEIPWNVHILATAIITRWHVNRIALVIFSAGAATRIGPWPPLCGFSNPIRNMVDLLWPHDEILDCRKGLYRQRTTQHINTKTNINAPSGIRTRDPSNQAAKTYASERAATGTGCDINHLSAKLRENYTLSECWHFDSNFKLYYYYYY
jgi:hypothetical protein